MADQIEGKTVFAKLAGQIVAACTKEVLQWLSARFDALSEDERKTLADPETFQAWWTGEVEKAYAVVDEAAMRAADAVLEADDDVDSNPSRAGREVASQRAVAPQDCPRARRGGCYGEESA